jgi:hypothetical protein
LTPYIIEYQFRKNLYHGSNYLFIIIILDLKSPYQISRNNRNWKYIKTYLIRASAEQFLRSIYLSNLEEIDYYLDILFATLSNIVIKIVPFVKLNIYTAFWWTAEVNTTIQNLKKAGRELTRNSSNFNIKEN